MHGSDNTLIAAYRRIERVRQVRSSLLSPFNPSGVYLPRLTRVSRIRGGLVVTLIRYTQITVMAAAGTASVLRIRAERAGLGEISGTIHGVVSRGR